MERIERDDIAAGKDMATLRDQDGMPMQGRALQSAENEGMRISGTAADGIGSRDTLFARMATYLRGQYDAFGRGQDLTLEQLLASLEKATDGNRLLRKQSAPLMFLIATDIKLAERFPRPGVPDPDARPLRAWRERYNGLDRFLPRPS